MKTTTHDEVEAIEPPVQRFVVRRSSPPNKNLGRTSSTGICSAHRSWQTSLENRFLFKLIAISTKPVRWSGAFFIWFERVRESTRSNLGQFVLSGVRAPVLGVYQSLFEFVFLTQQFLMFRLQFQHEILYVDNRKVGFFRFLSYGGIDIHLENKGGEVGYSFKARNARSKFSNHGLPFHDKEGVQRLS